MSSRRLGSRSRWWPLLAVLFVGCSSSRPPSDAHDHTTMPTGQTMPAGPTGAPDRPVAGVQGRVPQFLVICPFSHVLDDDPIVHPNDPGASHTHVFFGNNTTNAETTYESLQRGTSNCDQQLDTASYWAPALFAGDTMQVPVKSVAYYRPGEGVDPTTLQAYPPGLKIVAGNAAAVGPQSSAVVAWTCGVGIERAVTPPTCSKSRPLRMLVTFPDCWDGVHIDSADHFSHMAYSSGGSCPATHAVPVPQLQFSVVYAFSGDPSDLWLSSGDITTGHADFFNGWNQAKLEREIKVCLHRKVVCGITNAK